MMLVRANPKHGKSNRANTWQAMAPINYCSFRSSCVVAIAVRSWVIRTLENGEKWWWGLKSLSCETETGTVGISN